MNRSYCLAMFRSLVLQFLMCTFYCVFSAVYFPVAKSHISSRQLRRLAGIELVRRKRYVFRGKVYAGVPDQTAVSSVLVQGAIHARCVNEDDE